MENYDKMAALGARMFCEQDQEALLARFPLEHDERFLYIRMLGDAYRIDRADGRVGRAIGRAVEGAASALSGASAPRWEPASAQQALIVLDMACNRVGAPHPTGSWASTGELSGAASSPSTSGLYASRIDAFAGDPDRLRRACGAMGARAVPGGEVSFVFDVFEGVPLWLQFWDADDEFPAQMTFLWDKATALYLHYETLWYILFELLDRLLASEGRAEGAVLDRPLANKGRAEGAVLGRSSRETG